MMILAFERLRNARRPRIPSLLRKLETPKLLLHGGRSPSDEDQVSFKASDPPVPTKRPFERWKHGCRWQDPYHWMREDKQAAVEHLRRENRYAEAFMADTSCLQRTLEQEMASRVQREDVSSPPERVGSWLYYMKLPEGKEYPVYCRRKNIPKESKTPGSSWTKMATTAGWFQQDEEILLDQNSLVDQYGYAQVGTCRLSKDHCLMAYTLDTTGTEAFSLYVKDLRTGQVMNWEKQDSVVSVEWAANGRTVYCTVADGLLRPWRLLSRTLKSDAKDVVVFEEKDASRFVDVSRTKDWSFITVNVNSKSSSEVYLLNAQDSSGGLQLLQPRKFGIQYFVEHNDGVLYMLTNESRDSNCNEPANLNYRLVRSSLQQLELGHNWQEVVGAHPDVFIEDMEMFEKHLVLYLRHGGLPLIQVLDLPWASSLDRVRTLSLPQRICTVTPGANEEFLSDVLRVSVSSPNMPDAILEYDLKSGDAEVLHQDEVGGHKPSCRGKVSTSASRKLMDVLRSPLVANQSAKQIEHTAGWDVRNCSFDFSGEYVSQRHVATGADGIPVPLTVVHSRDLERNGKNPALLLAYGAYGQPLEVEWCSERLSLLDRGWVVAFAHVRGGGELGKAWHQAGRLLEKKNSFYDFVAVTNFLIDQNLADQRKVGAWGVSAGGLLVAGAVNMYPGLFRAVVLEVPFLDISNTLLDEDLPLSVHEFDEWGNPADKEAFTYIRSYSPYDNVQSGTPYPAALVKAGYLDTRVGYWEAAKWVARVRDRVGPNFPKAILLKTSMDTGHFAEGGKFGRLRDIAHDYAFLIKSMES